MAAIDNIINISISAAQSTVTTASTAIPLILGKSTPTGWDAGDVVHTYFAAADLLDDGFTETSPEYIYANLLCGQTTVPAEFRVAVRAGATVTEDLNDVIAADNSWYCLLMPGASDAEILEAATWTQGQKKIFVAVTGTSVVAQASSTDNLALSLKSRSLSRTALLFSPANETSGIEAGWVGGQLPQTPGSNTWAFKTIAGAEVDKLTSAQQSTLIGNPAGGIVGRNVNIYQAIAGANVTQMGTMASGDFIDQIVGTDALFFAMQSALLAVLTANAKIPQTDKGVAVLTSVVRACIDQAAVNGFIDPKQPITCDAAPVSTLTQAQKSTRQAPLITFSCIPQGAIHAVNVKGIEGAIVP